MTPDARIAAASTILDQILAGEPIEKALTNWARKSRYAGSGDRAAVRDLVFDTMRKRRSCAWVGGTETGRGLLMGLLRMRGEDLSAGFSGGRFGLEPVRDEEVAGFRELSSATAAVQLDCPDWVLPLIEEKYQDASEPILTALRERAPVFLRVNLKKATREEASDALDGEGIGTRKHDLANTALEVTSNPRRVQNSKTFRDGLVELQDSASQAAIELLSEHCGQTVLDYCAGGGGKSLGLAALGQKVIAHDANVSRIKEIPERAKRAGVKVDVVERAKGIFDGVLCDVPCSGTGAWRRQVDAKWQLTPDTLSKLNETQDAILDQASEHVRDGGTLCYMTCSLLGQENEMRVKAFIQRDPRWVVAAERQFTPLDGGDGFYVAILKQSA